MKAKEIARYLLTLDPKKEYFTKDSNGNFRINTMLHLIQMLYCAKYGKPAFKDKMLAYPPGWHKLSETGQRALDKIMSKNESYWTLKDLYKKEKLEAELIYE